MSLHFRVGSLVLYRQQPAIIDAVGDKITIRLEDGKSKKVRLKDIQLLHEGPVDDFGQIKDCPTADIEETWEMLQGETVTFAELAALIYDDYTPAAAWHTWLLLCEAEYFAGSLDNIMIKSASEVEEARQLKEQKAVEREAWQQYLQRVKAGKIIASDLKQLQDLQRLALKQVANNRTLRALNIESTPENAHKLLLKLGLWNNCCNPYPARYGCALTDSQLAVPVLPDEERRDLTSLRTFAIDDDSCHDPDDAVSLDGESIWVHVADVATLVRPDSELDLEARSRGSSLYLPEKVVNMLPPALTDILGLGLQEVSPALSFKLHCNEDGEVNCLSITPSWIRVERLSYAEAEALLDTAPLRTVYAISRRFAAKRVAAGAVNIALPEVKVLFDGGKEETILAGEQELHMPSDNCSAEFIRQRLKIISLEPYKSREMIAELMLMTGEAVAKFLLDHDIPAPFAAQPPPDESSVPETLSEMFACRKLFKRSELHTSASPHAGLGLEQYTRVTSPLRRYSDLLVHQQLRAFLKAEQLLDETALLERITEAEAGSRNSTLAGRQSERHWSLLYLEARPEESFRAVVVEKRDDRGVLLIPDLALEVKMRKLQRYNPDDEVMLRLNRINLPELELSCRIV